MAGAKNKRTRKEERRWSRRRRKQLELRAVLTGSPAAQELAHLYSQLERQ